MDAKSRYHVLTQGIRTVIKKILVITKGATGNKFATKDQERCQMWDHCYKIKIIS